MALMLRHNRNFRKTPISLRLHQRAYTRSVGSRLVPSLSSQQHPHGKFSTYATTPGRVPNHISENILENTDQKVPSLGVSWLDGLEWNYQYHFKQPDSPTKEPKVVEEREEGLLPTSVINKELRKNEKTNVTHKSKIPRFDTNQLASNSPIEDHHTELSNDAHDAWYFGVFDGHAGKYCSQKLANKLVHQVRHNIEKLEANEDQDVVDLISQSMIKTFENLDREIVWGSLGEIIINTEKAIHASLPAAVSGSCAIVGYVDTKTMNIFVANTGDSRAVIGSLGSDHKWNASEMSVDQNASNRKEREKLYSEHPGEEATVVSKERVLGSLAPTRAFGDSRYKWSARTQLAVKENFFPRMRSPPAHYHTPPYVTATPEVRHRQLTGQDKFMVIASDGLFDLLSNEEIVFLVGTYIEQKQTNNYSTTDPHPPKGKSRWAYVDDNAATHLIRNALGGNSKKELSKMLTIQAPHSRNLRDDITVTVIFFEDSV
ncbi:hypothetical protein K7432_000762 [Basidiobolus ranarum]|uniref:PPM-type phosphatase domain-containing protein n=1 Tax=Basidiobolus ranarum TaxID=34480 RepID=A0ABR2WAN6_9FUNG